MTRDLIIGLEPQFIPEYFSDTTAMNRELATILNHSGPVESLGSDRI